MNEFDQRSQNRYVRREISSQNPSSQAFNKLISQPSINAQFIESRIMSQNNSSLISNITKVTTFQPIQQQQQNMGLPQQSMVKPEVERPKSRNKLSVVSEVQRSTMGQHQKQGHSSSSSSLNKRSQQSLSRGGINVVSRNSSQEKKSSTSVEKNFQKPSSTEGNSFQANMPLCGLNCQGRNPFHDAQKHSQMTVVPNLGSLQTLKSQTTENQLSERFRGKNNVKSPLNFYDNISQVTHLQQKKSYEIQKENISNNHSTGYIGSNGKDFEKTFKQVRQVLEKEITVARKLYEKKFNDQIDSLNILYKSQIQTLQKVLGENQTLIQTQARKVQKLEQKCKKKEQIIQRYNERFASLYRFIQTSSAFALDRIREVETRFSVLLGQFSSLNVSSPSSLSFENKLSYTHEIFCSLIAQSVTKYRSIQNQIKQDVKQMLKKYDYFEQKIYQMDLLKHLGKQNQIQNYRLAQKIQYIKQQLVLLQSKSGFSLILPGNNKVNGQNQTISRDDQLYELNQSIGKIKNQLLIVENQKFQLQSQTNALEKDNCLLKSKNSQLSQQINRLQNQLVVKRQQRNEPSGRKFQFSTEKKPNSSAISQDQTPVKQPVSNLHKDLVQKTKQVQRLNQIIDQYQSKIEQLHSNIQVLQNQNTRLSTCLKQQSEQLNSVKNSNEHSSRQTQKTFTQLSHLLHEKQLKIQQLINKIQSEQAQKQQLSNALDMTQQIFDQQIQKFKETISKLQEENEQLLLQLNQLRQSQHMTNSVSKVSQNNNYNGRQQQKKLTLSKSPKNQTCQKVTMEWFKKNVSTPNQDSFTKTMPKGAFSPDTNGHKFIDKVKQYSSRSFNSNQGQQNDQFFYPSSNPNSSRQSFDSTSIMQSNQNISPLNQKSSPRTQKQAKGRINKKEQNQVYSFGGPTSSTSRLQSLLSLLKQSSHSLPVAIMIDSQNQLQFYPSKMYIVDQNYRTFCLSQQQLKTAQQKGILRLFKQNYNEQCQQTDENDDGEYIV